MITSEIVSEFRAEMSDTVAPYLWSDEELYWFLNQAQQEFCRRTDGISDAVTTSVCQWNVTPSAEWYPINPLILNIRQVTRGDNGRQVRILTADQALERKLRFNAEFTGLVRFAVLGLDSHNVRLWPFPDETVTLNLLVYRLPLLTITSTLSQTQTPEIDPQHHSYLVLWMKYRAYNKQDTEVYDKQRAADAKQEFIDYCTKAKQEQARARRSMGNVAYAGPHISHHHSKEFSYGGHVQGSLYSLDDYGQ